jgi:hypothetical protein
MAPKYSRMKWVVAFGVSVVLCHALLLFYNFRASMVHSRVRDSQHNVLYGLDRIAYWENRSRDLREREAEPAEPKYKHISAQNTSLNQSRQDREFKHRNTSAGNPGSSRRKLPTLVGIVKRQLEELTRQAALESPPQKTVDIRLVTEDDFPRKMAEAGVLFHSWSDDKEEVTGDLPWVATTSSWWHKAGKASLCLSPDSLKTLNPKP